MDESHIDVEVAYAQVTKQVIIAVSLPVDSSVDQAIQCSGVLETFPEIDLTQAVVGIFGKPCQLQKKLLSGDRVEIYRPLFQHPMEARRNRVSQ